MGSNETVLELRKIYPIYKEHKLTLLSEEDFIKEKLDYVFNNGGWDNRVANRMLEELKKDIVRAMRENPNIEI